ncbi:MAG: HAD family hydrolase [Thermodesulfobacteriota bacterium]
MTDDLSPKLRRARALVFDFDGTLASLEIDFAQMRRQVLELALTYGLEPGDFDGRYVLEGLDTAKAKLSAADPAAAESFIRRALTLIEEMELTAARRGGLFPGTRSALRSLNRAGLALGVITRNCRAAVALTFPDLMDYCRVFLPREDVVRVKPDPAHLLAALRELNIPPSDAVMVGDHPLDMATGRAAGAMTAGLASGRLSRAELSAAGADATFAGIAELAEYMLGGT